MALPVVVAVTMFVSACGDDDAAEAVGGSGEDPAVPSGDESDVQELAEYCQLVAAYLDVTENIDTTSAETVVVGLEASAQAARAVADAAPPEIEEASDTLAEAAAALSAALRQRDPQTVGELEQANAELVPQIEAEFGTLDREAAQVERFDEENCGLSFDG